MGWDRTDYVDVAERVNVWHTRYPDGRIIPEIVTDFTDMTTLVVIRAEVFKSQNPDELPSGVGHSYLAIPGGTPFTKGSELENAETSAVGRALVMAGVPAKNVSSTSEIASKTPLPPSKDGTGSPAPVPLSGSTTGEVEGSGPDAGETAQHTPTPDATTPAPSPLLDATGQQVLADALGGKANAVKIAHERWPSVRRMADITPDQARELMEANA